MTYRDIGRDLGDVVYGQHYCSIYRNKKEQFSQLIPFIREGFDSNQKCIYVIDENTEEELITEFARFDCGLEKYIASGQLEILTKKETYYRDGIFEPEKMLALIGEMERKALAQGYDGMRGSGETTWVLTRPEDDEKLIEYESDLNGFISDRKIILLCQYNEKKFSHKILNNVIRTHPYTIVYGKVYENKYFYTTHEYLEGGSNMLPADAYKVIIDTITTED